MVSGNSLYSAKLVVWKQVLRGLRRAHQRRELTPASIWSLCNLISTDLELLLSYRKFTPTWNREVKRKTFRLEIFSQQRRMFSHREIGMLFQRKKKVRRVKIMEMNLFLLL